MALGLGYGLPFAVKRPVQGFAEDVTLATNNALADAAQREEAGNCLTARAMQIMQDVQTQPSLLVVPQLYKAGVLYDQLPTTRTNFIPNNSMAGATGSVLPTTWASGSIPAGFTFSVGASGQATANDGTLVNYVDVSVSGTATASGTFNLFFSAATGAVTATTGQTFTLSAYATCISGDITTPAMVLQVQEVSGSTFQAGTSTNIALASGAVLQRLSAVRTFNQSGVTAARGRIGHPIVSGTTYSYTIRIASPQLERLGVATPMIATSTGAVTRLNESTNVVGLPPDFTVSRNTTATRVNSSGLIESVASGVPRIDWLGQSCPALLVEASGQNLALQSAGFQVSGNWAPTNISVSTGTTAAFTAPDGSTDADLLTATANGSARIIQSFSFVSGTTYTYSAFAKAGSGFFGLTMENGGVASGAAVIWNLNTGAVAVSGTQGTGYALQSQGIENYGNGWYRCRMTVLMSVSVTGNIRANTADGTMSSTVIQSASGNTAYVWGAQVEVGSVATTYIPTTAAAVSRAADVISASGALVSGLIGQTEGTIYAEVDVRSSSAGSFISIDVGDGSNFIIIAKSSNFTILVQLRRANGSVVTIITSSAVSIGVHKIALAYTNGNYVLYIDGNSGGISSDSTNYPASTLTRCSLANTSYGIFNDRIRAAALYTTRLTDAQLAELTRL
jgi:hypothetical protein